MSIFDHKIKDCLQVLQEAQGVVEAWPPTGAPQLAHEMVSGGETAALAALSAYTTCRLRSRVPAPAEQAGPSGRWRSLLDTLQKGRIFVMREQIPWLMAWHVSH